MQNLNRIKPKHLELMLKIDETQQLQLAARAVAISQPAASRILADLEAQLGSDLFIRHPAGMEPTPAGRILLRHARVVVSELGTMWDELNHLRSGSLGDVRVGAVTGPAVGCLMPAVQSIQQDYPDLRISVDVAPSATLFRKLEEAHYDFIMGRTTPGYKRTEFRFHPGRTEIVSLMVHKSHPLAGQDPVDLAELAAYPWVNQEEGFPIREAIENSFHNKGVSGPSRVLNTSSLIIALSQVAEGQAISPQTKEVMTLLTSQEIGANLTELKTSAPVVVAPYFVIQDSRRKLSRAAERVLHEVLKRM